MKRFWKTVTVEPAESGHAIRLDTRPLRTPAKRPVVVPAAQLAEAMAAEWAACGETVDPLAMPVTRAVNVTIDRVMEAEAEVAAAVAAYGESDLICYRAPHPAGLVARQSEAWDPLLRWLEERHRAPLVLAEGVMHVSQPPASVARLQTLVGTFGPWELTPLHELVSLSGSLVIGLAVSAGEIGAEEGWRRSRIDEDWNIEEWGEDAEAAAQAAQRRESFLAAARLMALLRAG